MTEKMWYAVQVDGYDAWDYGSYDLDEAKKMALGELDKLGDGVDAVIAFIDEDPDDPFCVGGIRYINGEWE